jgi:NifB/MoaA-like Fe-S oxidoreductase
MFLKKKTDMKLIILVSNLKEISPSVFSWKKKDYIKNYDAILLPGQYSYDLTVNSFGKAFAHVRNCLLMEKAHGTNRIVELNKILDGFYAKTTQKTDMKFIILVSNLKEISPSVFSWEKEYIKKTTMQFYC